eukprot:CAMPEP_0178437998 /NCGR_PEP_ID=MMETSP0689_2-20121128/35317_1 /TAXON_ID=160604 /ORGANISM="Amphidinium massartii, Strain CS-259" /LENGTH=694 /DNA_ID=CAMNT_0020060289 /DNA_START=26 /DNA_END=2110 /DNA_ORIENTATION=-
MRGSPLIVALLLWLVFPDLGGTQRLGQSELSRSLARVPADSAANLESRKLEEEPVSEPVSDSQEEEGTSDTSEAEVYAGPEAESEGEAVQAEGEEEEAPVEEEGASEEAEGAEVGEADGAEAEGEEGAESAEEDEEEAELEEVEGGEGGEVEDEVNVQVACMLLGGVAFVLLLFRLVNYEDDDIRRYAWRVISSVTSIFVAVMMFNAVNKGVLALAPTRDPRMICAIQYLHLFVWILMLQVCLACVSGAVGVGRGSDQDLLQDQWVIADALRSDFESVVEEREVRNSKGTKSIVYRNGKMEVPVEKKQMKLEKRNRGVKCYTTIFAHMAGFAAINAGGTMQHLKIFRETPLTALIPVALNQFFVIVLFSTFKRVRAMVRSEHERKSAAAAAEEKDRDARETGMVIGELQRQTSSAVAEQETFDAVYDMYEEAAMEAENDISSLAGSFLLVQVVRYVLTGELPDMAGVNRVLPDDLGVDELHLIGMVFACLSVVLILITPKLGLEEDSHAGRVMEVLTSGAGMSFAWCILFAARWMFMKNPRLEEAGVGVERIAGRIILALALSVASMAVIFVLDKLDDDFMKGADGQAGNREGATIIVTVVNAISILVGFSWEHAFDGSVEVISGLTSNPLITETGLAICVALLIVPSWRHFILKRAIQLQDYKKRQDEASAAAARASNGGGEYGAIPAHESPR